MVEISPYRNTFTQYIIGCYFQHRSTSTTGCLRKILFDTANESLILAEFIVNVRESLYSILPVTLFFSVTFNPIRGANLSVIITDDISNGEEGMGLPVSSSRTKPKSPSDSTQLRNEVNDPTA